MEGVQQEHAAGRITSASHKVIIRRFALMVLIMMMMVIWTAQIAIA